MSTQEATKVESDTSPENVQLRPPRWGSLRATIRRRSRAIVTGVAVLAVVLAALDFVLTHKVDDQRNEQTASAAAAAASKKLVPEVLGYSYRSLSADLARGLNATTGKFHDDLSQLQKSAVAPTAQQKKVVTSASVTGVGVVMASKSAVKLLVFVTQNSTADGGTPQIDGSRLSVTMTKVDGAWRISQLTPV